MSVYKEAWYAIQKIEANSIQIFNDAADFGVPVKINDPIWKTAKSLATMYGDNRRDEKYSTGRTITHDLEIADEGSKTWHKFRLEFVTSTDRRLREYAGVISVYPV